MRRLNKTDMSAGGGGDRENNGMMSEALKECAADSENSNPPPETSQMSVALRGSLTESRKGASRREHRYLSRRGDSPMTQKSTHRESGRWRGMQTPYAKPIITSDAPRECQTGAFESPNTPDMMEGRKPDSDASKTHMAKEGPESPDSSYEGGISEEESEDGIRREQERVESDAEFCYRFFGEEEEREEKRREAERVKEETKTEVKTDPKEEVRRKIGSPCGGRRLRVTKGDIEV